MTLKQIIDYIKSKHIYPIMHTIAMTAETANRYADCPAKLTEAFREAKRLSVQYMKPREIEGYEKEKAVPARILMRTFSAERKSKVLARSIDIRSSRDS
jgi:hypothetical protein